MSEIDDIDVSEESPIKQVEVTVPKTDDPAIPVLTFRTWVLGLFLCILLSLINQFFWYRTQPMMITSISAQIAVVPAGHLLARILPASPFFRGSRWEFTMNPGPFNIKEHVLITIFANSGAGTVYASHILTAVKIMYKRKLTFFPALVLMITTQVLGFGWAGIFRKYLVEPAEMWWPSNLVQVSLFHALHDKSKRPKGSSSRTQFFLLVMISSFAYYIVPGYLFTMITSLAWVCWIAPNSVLAHQVGSGLQGLGIGTVGIDWPTISSYLGSPLASPWFATANIAIGFVLIMYVMNPISYWLDVYHAKTFPMYSSTLFMSNGTKYNIDKIVDSHFHLDTSAYSKYGPVHLTTFFAMTYGLGFAGLTATVVHVLLFNGREVWKQTKRAFGGKSKLDIHSKLMKRYKSVPTWWFVGILVVNIGAIVWTCEYYNETLQLRWWGVLLACALAIFFTLPIGIISATTNQQPGLNVITEYMMGYLYPERPVANMCFKVYGYISMVQALTFVADFKLGHYMKIPPRAMFAAQVVGQLVASLVYTVAAWWMMEGIPHICDTDHLPANSPWKCPMDRVFFDSSVVWGLVGPRRMFGDEGEYGRVNWFFLVGAVAPVLVWAAHKAFPKHDWIQLIHMPVLLNATAMMPPASAVNFTSWIIVAFLSGYVVFRYRPKWWSRYNYVLSGGLDAGSSFATILLFLALQSNGIGIEWWGNDVEGCPLAACPTAKGVVASGCPVVT